MEKLEKSVCVKLRGAGTRKKKQRKGELKQMGRNTARASGISSMVHNFISLYPHFTQQQAEVQTEAKKNMSCKKQEHYPSRDRLPN